MDQPPPPRGAPQVFEGKASGWASSCFSGRRPRWGVAPVPPTPSPLGGGTRKFGGEGRIMALGGQGGGQRTHGAAVSLCCCHPTSLPGPGIPFQNDGWGGGVIPWGGVLWGCPSPRDPSEMGKLRQGAPHPGKRPGALRNIPQDWLGFPRVPRSRGGVGGQDGTRVTPTGRVCVCVRPSPATPRGRSPS